MALAAAGASLGACSPTAGTSAPGDGGPTSNQGEASSTSPGPESGGGGGEASESTPLDGGGPKINGCSYCDPTADGGASGNLEVNFVSAGTITIDDGAMILATLADDGDAEVAYETDSNLNPGIAWKAGDSLSVVASGGVLTGADVVLLASPPRAQGQVTFSN